MDTTPQLEPKPIEPENVEPELYVEPPRMAVKDMAGVIVALLALAVIGFSGYIWLNPSVSWQNILHHPAAKSEQAAAPVVLKGGTETKSHSGAAGDPVKAEAPASATHTNEAHIVSAGVGTPPPTAENAAEDFTCAQCGMDASRSASYVVAHWTDHSSGHFDSWDCAFKYAKDQAKTLSSAEVNQFGADSAGPQMLAAANSWFLYDTKKKVTGSMPPYVAAYPDAAAAKAAQPEMGGEAMDFAGLKRKWG